jgi:Xaa-Pro aminopeptidase
MEGAVVAVEEPVIPSRVYDGLRKGLPRACFVDGEDMINDIMMIKDEEELELMRRVCAIADAGTQAIIDHATVGITEAELMGHAELAMRRVGCAYYYTPNQCNFDNRVICDHIPTDRILQPGNKIAFDLHPSWHEYRSDYFRTLSVGQPDSEYAKMAACITDIAYELNARLVPGASTKEIEIWFRERVKKAGYPDRAMKDIGHGIGTGHLPPFFLTNKEWILKENMIISICPYIYDPGNYNLLMEYCVRVRQGGDPELLNKHPLGLIIV